MSSGKKTKHIKAKFFFIKDKIDSGEIKVIDCLSEEMWADVLTKPLQGMAFQTMQAELMKCLVNYEDESEQMMREERNETRRGAKKRSTTKSPKTVTWKSVIASPFRTPQECVGHSGISTQKRGTDRHLRETTYYRGNVRLKNGQPAWGKPRERE
jgi:hypothetical protein